MRISWPSALLALAALLCLPAAETQAQQPTGTLVVNVKPFRSERELPKKVKAQLESGGLEWGQRDDQLVFTMVNKRFIDFPVHHMTRYGQSESLPLPAGTYRITGIGMEMTAGFNVQKILDRGAYVNQDVLTLTVEAGKTTTLDIDPVIYKDNAFVVNFWMPTLVARVTMDGTASPDTALNTRTPTSVAWPNYKGPLKFVAK